MGMSTRGLLVCLAAMLTMAAGMVSADNVAERRVQVLEAAARGVEAIPALEAALKDDNALVRRAAVRGLMGIGSPAREALTRALGSEDGVVRRAALVALAPDPTPDALPYIEMALSDEDVSIREFAVRLLLAVRPTTEQVIELLQKAEQDAAPLVHRPAGLRLTALDPGAEPFEVDPPDTVLLRDRPDIAADRIEAAFTLPLPRDDWRFRADTRQQGHRDDWFAADYDDSGWDDISIEQAWTPGYIGVGWYRREIELPERPEHLAAELHFDGVDESAWVWVNGVYVGGQDIGAGGWNVPFRVDVTEQVRWGESNQITVRAMNTAAAGGIWRPVRIEALTLR